MKADMTKLTGDKPGRTGPYERWMKAGILFALCLTVLGGGMVMNALHNRDDANADEIYDETEANPSFTVQQAADVTLPDIQAGDGDIPVLTMKGGGYSASLDEEKQVRTKTERVNLYAEYKTDWLSADTLGQMSYVDPESSSYVLKEVWFGKNPASGNQSDFLVARVDDVDKVHLTNNPDCPGLSQAEGGYYIPASDGTYTVCIANGDAVRLVYGEKEGWSYTDVKAYDYDITDGGYYLEDDYFHLGDRKETSGWEEETVPVYVDCMKNGINSEDNYKVSGTKLAFGADKAGMVLAEESITGELNTPNIFNYEQQEKTDGTGATLGLVKSIDTDGDLIWADGIAAPNLFGGAAAGKKDYKSGYSFAFARKGTGRTLAAVESEWGTAAEGLETIGSPFWAMDDAPSSATDGHDIAWGDGNENVLYYRSGDRAPEAFGMLGDGQLHNRYFGFMMMEDFVLEPGYTGPLNVFGISDDDLWVFVARIGDDGKIMTDTAVQAVDLGGVHESAGGWCDLWNMIDRVPYGEEAQNWRLFVFWLERDGITAEFGLSMNLPEAGMKTIRETGSVMVEASDYQSAKGEARTFVLSNGTHDRYKATFSDGREMTIADGEEFQIPGGMFVSIDGLDAGNVFTVTETGRKSVWHSTGDGYEEGDTAQCTVGHGHRISFISTVDSGTLSLAVDAADSPEGGYTLNVHLEGMGNKEVSAMDGYNSPLGSRFTDENGDLQITLAAGEVLTLYGVPDGTPFNVTPADVPGWHVAEILLDKAEADGLTVSGVFPAYAIYRYLEDEIQAPTVKLEQSVSGDWSDEDIIIGTGALLSYRLTVTNPNKAPVKVIVEDEVPEGLTVMESSVLDGAVDGQKVSWEVLVDPGTSLELSFTCQAEAEDGTAFENRASFMMDEERISSNTVKAEIP